MRTTNFFNLHYRRLTYCTPAPCLLCVARSLRAQHWRKLCTIYPYRVGPWSGVSSPGRWGRLQSPPPLPNILCLLRFRGHAPQFRRGLPPLPLALITALAVLFLPEEQPVHELAGPCQDPAASQITAAVGLQAATHDSTYSYEQQPAPVSITLCFPAPGHAARVPARPASAAR